MFIPGLLFLLITPLIGLLLWAGEWSRALPVHGVFALAALPLMWAAILHFVPVLTRSQEAPPHLRSLPWIAFMMALLLLATLAGHLPRPALLLPALSLAASALLLAGWIIRRARHALGQPHPGVRWYLASLICLALALTAVVGMTLDPARYPQWYAFHLHLNLFGWVGLTVLGTLPVLLPTAMQQFDPLAAIRLRTTLVWALSGALLIALAAALRWPTLSIAGGSLLLLVVFAHLRRWLSLYGAPWRWPGPAQSLFLGALFLCLLLGLGMLHGMRADAASPLFHSGALLPAFVCGFLLPTVLGALAQLLPVWRSPGPDSPPRRAYQRALSRGSAARGGLAFLAGLGQLSGITATLGLAVAAVLWLLLVALLALRKK